MSSIHRLMSLLLFVLLESSPRAAAQEISAEEFKIESASFVMVRDTIIITYELIATQKSAFDVDVVLRRTRDTTFAFPLSATVGAVGRVQGGGKKVILWKYRDDIADQFEYAHDYWFEITAVPVEEGFEIKWWYYPLAGAGLVSAILVAVGGQDEQGNTTLGRLPDPPLIRPTP